MGMRTEHLTPDELEAFSRGEVTDLSVELHLRNCAECREAAREAEFGARYLRPLAGDHPDEDVLTALWSHALPPSRETELRSHVETCSRCRSVLARLESATPVAARPHRVSQEAMALTRAWAVASTGPRQASLVVRAAEGLNRLRTSFESIAGSLRFGGLTPEPTALHPAFHEPEQRFELRAVRFLQVEPQLERVFENASDDAAEAEKSESELRRRRDELEGALKSEMEQRRHSDERIELLKFELEKVRRSSELAGAERSRRELRWRRSEETAEAGEAAAKTRDPLRSAPTVLNDGKHSFRFETKREETTTRLVVGFVETKRPADAAAVGITFDSPGHPTRRADLALGGEAVFEISPGTSHLSIGVRPSWEIEIHLDA